MCGAQDPAFTSRRTPPKLDRMIWLAVVRRPFYEIRIEEAPRSRVRIDFQQHIGVGVITRRRHDVVLRPVGVGEVDPLVQMPGYRQLDGVLVFSQKGMQPVIAEFGGLDGQ